MRVCYNRARVTPVRFRCDRFDTNRNDPHQVHNLAADAKHAQRLDQFRGQLKRRMKAINDDFQQCTWYRENWTTDRNTMRGAKGGRHDLEALRTIVQKYFG